MLSRGWNCYDSQLPLVVPEHCGEAAGATIRWWERSPDRQDDFPREKGYVTHLVEATADGKRVGYVRVGYADEELSYEASPTGLHFLAEHAGWCFDPDQEDARSLWCRVHLYAKRTPLSLAKRGKNTPFWMLREEDAPGAATIASDLAPILEWGQELRKKWLRWASTPSVAYSYVDNGQRSGVDWRRRGIGQEMYIHAARHLGSRGKVLARSSNLSPSAMALWNGMEASPAVRTAYLRLPTVRGGTSRKLVLDYRQ